jgi:hypothetical protein
VVEEIDFIKRNLVNLAYLNTGRTNCNAFLVNDSIFVFGGTSADIGYGEKYIMKENRWREISFKGLNSGNRFSEISPI